nr:hypothetical protein StreXyl84_16150 [Streptomyces sp. Xyl84]
MRMTEREGAEAGAQAGQRSGDEAGRGVVTAFGQTLKTLRPRVGLEREESGRQFGYSASTIASFEQGRRIPSPRTIERADEVLKAQDLLCLWKEQVERVQYPVGGSCRESCEHPRVRTHLVQEQLRRHRGRPMRPSRSRRGRCPRPGLQSCRQSPAHRLA